MGYTHEKHKSYKIRDMRQIWREPPGDKLHDNQIEIFANYLVEYSKKF